MLSVAFLIALLVTVIWLVYHATTHSAKRRQERDFNEPLRERHNVPTSNSGSLDDLLSSMPHRRVAIDAGTVAFWTGQTPLSMAIARTTPTSPFKLYVRADRPAHQLGHRLLLSTGTAASVALKLTAESLIFSAADSTFYEIDATSLERLTMSLGEGLCANGGDLDLDADDARALAEWFRQAIHVRNATPGQLLIGE